MDGRECGNLPRIPSQALLILTPASNGIFPVNEYRRARVAEILADFTNLQFYIAAAPVDPPNQNDYHTEGWRTLRQCAADGHYILNTGADTHVPTTRGGSEEQSKAELQQVHLDALARRHQGKKIYLRQAAAQRWIGWRDSVLQGKTPSAEHQASLRACDEQFWMVWLSDLFSFSLLCPMSFCARQLTNRNLHKLLTRAFTPSSKWQTYKWAAGSVKTPACRPFSAGYAPDDKHPA